MSDKVFEKCRQKIRNMKKEDYIVLLLLGVLLLIVSLPTERGKEEKKNTAVTGEEKGQEGGGEEGGEHAGRLWGAEGTEGDSRSAESAEDTAVEAWNFNGNERYDIDIYVENLEKRLQELSQGKEGDHFVQ